MRLAALWMFVFVCHLIFVTFISSSFGFRSLYGQSCFVGFGNWHLRKSWFCLSGDFLLKSLSNRPFGDFLVFVRRLLEGKSPEAELPRHGSAPSSTKGP